MLDEAQARKLAAMLTKQQKQDIALLARVLRTDPGRGQEQRPEEGRTYERAANF